jgi:hypothetical protein
MIPAFEHAKTVHATEIGRKNYTLIIIQFSYPYLCITDANLYYDYINLVRDYLER